MGLDPAAPLVFTDSGYFRENRTGPNEYGLLLTFTLKDFPAISLPINLDPQGQGIAGKNK